MRGFRWQILALLMAIVLFVIALFSRSTGQTPQLNPTPLPPTSIASQTTATPLPEATLSPTSDAPVVIPPPETSAIPTYREALVGQVQRLNPLLAGLNPVDWDITSLIYEGLMRTNAYGEPEPALASGMPVISFDGLEYVVALRNDVLWQDGIPFTADDVVYTMSLLSSPDFPGLPELGAFWRTVETEKINDNLVRFRLAQPLGSFIEALRVLTSGHFALSRAARHYRRPNRQSSI